eukprot:gb/GEZN01004337.1/.p1 GENE.gb/GEZN01004337.1/~~gb/GEZN01004337.1/.p1  ORF type:complete len:654 (-),score=88.54 gb/GEZN01004337.1/:24-1952(-)
MLLALPNQLDRLKGLRGLIFLLSAPDVLTQTQELESDEGARRTEVITDMRELQLCWQRDRVRLRAMLERLHRSPDLSFKLPLLFLFYPPVGRTDVSGSVSMLAARRVQSELGSVLDSCASQISACSVQPLFFRACSVSDTSRGLAKQALGSGLCWLASRAPAPPLLSPIQLPPLLETIWLAAQTRLQQTLLQPLIRELAKLGSRCGEWTPLPTVIDPESETGNTPVTEVAEWVVSLWNESVKSMAEAVCHDGLPDLSWPPSGPGLSSLHNLNSKHNEGTQLPPVWWNGEELRRSAATAFASLALPPLPRLFHYQQHHQHFKLCLTYLHKLPVPTSFTYPSSQPPILPLSVPAGSLAPLEASLARIFRDERLSVAVSGDDQCLSSSPRKRRQRLEELQREAEVSLQRWLGPVRHARVACTLQWTRALLLIVRHRLEQAHTSLSGVPLSRECDGSRDVELSVLGGLWTPLSSGQLVKAALQRGRLDQDFEAPGKKAQQHNFLERENGHGSSLLSSLLEITPPVLASLLDDVVVASSALVSNLTSDSSPSSFERIETNLPCKRKSPEDGLFVHHDERSLSPATRRRRSDSNISEIDTTTSTQKSELNDRQGGQAGLLDVLSAEKLRLTRMETMLALLEKEGSSCL